MKRLLVITSLLLLFSGTALAAGVDSWAGPHVGVRVGWNHSELNNFGSADASTAGVEMGWNISINNWFVVDPQLFYEWNQDKDRQTCHSGGDCTSANLGSRVYGFAVILGLPVGANDDLMPYIRLADSRLRMSGDESGSSWNSWSFGAGLEWRLNHSVGLVLQYVYAKYGGDVDDWENSNLTLGVNFHF